MSADARSGRATESLADPREVGLFYYLVAMIIAIIHELDMHPQM